MRIDLNADLGEAIGDDDAMLRLATSANVSCGFHAGGPDVLARTVEHAAEHGVVVGAHISYRDRANFGRAHVDIAPDVLRAETVYQLGALEAACRVAGARLAYVKPHGALYHAITVDEEQAAAVVSAIVAFDPSLALLGLPGTVAVRLAREAGLRTVVEAFADRAYLPDGNLVPRGRPGAVLHDPETVAARMVSLVTSGSVEAVDGTPVALAADSICVHGDSPGAVAMARATRTALESCGAEVVSFA